MIVTLLYFGIISQVLGHCKQSDVVEADACAIVYKGEHCDGESRKVEVGDKSYPGRDWDNKITSLVVNMDDDCALQVFTKKDYKGKEASFQEDADNLNHHKYGWPFKKTWSNKISSWKCKCNKGGTSSQGGSSKAGNSGGNYRPEYSPGVFPQGAV